MCSKITNLYGPVLKSHLRLRENVYNEKFLGGLFTKVIFRKEVKIFYDLRQQCTCPTRPYRVAVISHLPFIGTVWSLDCWGVRGHSSTRQSQILTLKPPNPTPPPDTPRHFANLRLHLISGHSWTSLPLPLKVRSRRRSQVFNFTWSRSRSPILDWHPRHLSVNVADGCSLTVP